MSKNNNLIFMFYDDIVFDCMVLTMVCLTNPPFWTFRLFLVFSITKYAIVVSSVDKMLR